MLPPAIAGALRTTFELPRYASIVSPQPYLAQVTPAALHNGRVMEEIALALEGKAMQVLVDLTPAKQRDYPTVAATLQYRFGQQITTDDMRDRLAHQ